MDDPFAPPMHSWSPPKITPSEMAALSRRWLDLDLEAALRRPPFPPTAEGRNDLRYFPFLRGESKLQSSLQKARFRNCDFTAARMDVLAERCIFDNCIFDRADMTQFNEKGCTFTGCAFVATDLRYASIGSDWNNSKPGEFASTYRDCLVQDAKLAKLLVGDPFFINCRFVFKRLKTVDWECAGFWGCNFEGVFEDMLLRGEYFSGNSADRKGHPARAGLHATSFRDAKLRWIDLRDGCPLDKVEMPADGRAFVASPIRIVAGLDRIAAACPDEAARKLATSYIKLIRTSHAEDRKSILSVYELWEPDEPENEAPGRWAYGYLKTNYRAA